MVLSVVKAIRKFIDNRYTGRLKQQIDNKDKDNKVLISERNDNNLFAVSRLRKLLWYVKHVLCGVPLQFARSADCL